jgi:hypothetical protein
VMALGLMPLVRALKMPTTPPVERHVMREARLHKIDNRPSLPGARTRQIDMPLYPSLHSLPWWAGVLDDGWDRGTAQGWSVGDVDHSDEANALDDTTE